MKTFTLSPELPHVLFDLLLRRIAGLFLLGGDLFAHFLPPNLADGAQDRVYMIGSELINGIFNRLVDVAAIDGAFDKSGRLASIARQ